MTTTILYTTIHGRRRRIPVTAPGVRPPVARHHRRRPVTPCRVPWVLALVLLVLVLVPPVAAAAATATAPPSRRRRNRRVEETITSSAERLVTVLAAHDLTTSALASMALQSYFPQSPYNVSQYNTSQYWTANIVTPVPQGINGSLIQAVLFENPEQTERVLTFMGVYINPGDPATNETNSGNPYSTCLAADYEFTGTAGDAAFQDACEEFGRVDTQLHEWRQQAQALIETTAPTFLTGHSQGCTFALSEAVLSYNTSTATMLPTVCFSNPGGLTPNWIENYDPELVRRLQQGNNINGKDSIFTLQTYTDPFSNCLAPSVHTNTKTTTNNTTSQIATVCSFAGSSVAACGMNTTFSHQVFSPCVAQSHYVANMQAVPDVFATTACTTDFTPTSTSSDWTGRVCPHQTNTSNPVIEDGDATEEEETTTAEVSSVLPSESSTTSTSSGIRLADRQDTGRGMSFLVGVFFLAASQLG